MHCTYSCAIVRRLQYSLVKDRQQEAAGDWHRFSVFPVFSETMVLITVHYISNDRSDFSLSYDMTDIVIK